jgi:hypothetical protein
MTYQCVHLVARKRQATKTTDVAMEETKPSDVKVEETKPSDVKMEETTSG